VRLVSRAGLLALVVVAATATAASAHPGFRPGDVPAGGPAEVVLVVPHGCGVDGQEPVDGGPSSPTTVVAVSMQEGLRLDPLPRDGFTATVEQDDTVAVWEATDGGVDGELVLPAIVEVAGTVGEDLLVPVYQECANGEFHRWAAGPGEDGDPVVTLGIAAGEPEPLPTPTSVAASPTPDPTPSATPPPSPTRSPTTTPTPSPTPSAMATATPSPMATPSPLAAADPEGDGGGGAGWWLVVAAMALVAAGGVAWARRNGDEDSAT